MNFQTWSPRRFAPWALLLLAWMQAAVAAPALPALSRPALMVKAPERVALLGAARAGKRLVVVGERGVIAYSDDQGKQWKQAQVPTSVGLTAVQFVDERTGWAVGHGGVVLHSRDAGQSWSVQLDGVRAAQAVMVAAQATGQAEAMAEAERLVADGADKPFFDLHFSDARNGLVVGAYNLVLRTGDGGQTWTSLSQRVPNPRALHLYKVRVRGQEVLLAGEQGLVLHSSDAGATFRPLQLPYEGSYFTAELPGQRDLVVAGMRGNAFVSRDAGLTWQALAVKGGAPSSFQASHVDPFGRTWLANQAGGLFRLDGDTLLPIGKNMPPVTDLLMLQGELALTLSMTGARVIPLNAAGAKP